MGSEDPALRERLRAFLAASPVFGPQAGPAEPAGITDSDRDVLAQEARIEDLEDGEVLWAMGDQPYALGVVLEGVLAVRRPPEDAPATVLRRLGPGAEVGFSTLGGQPHTADLVTVGSTRVAILDHTLLFPILGRRPGLALRMLAQLGHIIGLLTDEKLELLAQSVRDRVQMWILKSIAPGEELEVSQEHIAECVSATRPRVSAVLKELEREGVVALRRGRVGRPGGV